ncbi:RuBisCO large subunit C-terminal-like domain-containing protein [Thermithiobacillus plumbiphilus]|uniref:RuBisCO large subunit C-terminal-like domain-containing protein n=1 Tax=Thermithiobacillus plumbiphilus TaxID=1729899 RepID=A0ABU9D5H3_9PROT
MNDQIEVSYRFPPGVDAGRQARVIAVGQTAGSWDARFQHREAQLREHLAEVLSVEPLSDGSHAAKVAFPRANVSGDIGSLLTMIFGKYSLGGPAKVIRLKLPDDYGLRPRFGIQGIRERLGVQDRPLVMAIFKPALGLSADDHAEILREVAFAGLDIIKDDEILPDLSEAPTIERVRACRRVIEEVGRETGREPVYAVNLSGRADQLLAQARMLVAEGANALLLNVLPYGYAVLEALATDPSVQVPIFTHPALAGAWCAAPDHGFDYGVVLGTLIAHAGADAVLYPAHYGSLPFAAETEADIRDILRGRGVFPVPSAGIHPGVVPRALWDYGKDVILNAGGGIMDHPEGPAAGVKAFFEALDRAVPGQAFRLQDVPEGPLRTALVRWGVA